MRYDELAILATSLAVFLVPMSLGLVIEMFIPATDRPIGGVVFNLAYTLLATVLKTLAVAIVSGSAVLVTNAAGGGLIDLPSEGWLLVPAVAAYTIAMDFGEFLFHRAQHRVPALWAMHALHHSDPAMNVSTTHRHFWAEQAIKTVTIYLLGGLLFRANAQIVSIYGMIMFFHLFFHMNIPLGFGRCWFLLNSPQYHRAHHSALPEHQDRNFSGLFPIFDVIFGSAYRPRSGEFPRTGLHDGDSPRGLLEAIVWPVRGILRRRFTAQRS